VSIPVYYSCFIVVYGAWGLIFSISVYAGLLHVLFLRLFFELNLMFVMYDVLGTIGV